MLVRAVPPLFWCAMACFRANLARESRKHDAMFTEHDLLPRANEWLRMAKHVCAIAVVLCLSELRGDRFLLGGGRSTPLCPTLNLKPKWQRPTRDVCTSAPAPSFFSTIAGRVWRV